MLKVLARASDRIEAWCAHPVALILAVAWCCFMPIVSMDVANYGISVITALLLFLTIGAARRDRKAVHTKLDDIECAIPGARDDLARLEDRLEHEIDEAREAGL